MTVLAENGGRSRCSIHKGGLFLVFGAHFTHQQHRPCALWFSVYYAFFEGVCRFGGLNIKQVFVMDCGTKSVFLEISMRRVIFTQ